MNSMNTFRTVYRPLSPVEQEHVNRIKDVAEELWALFNMAPKSATREMALARTKLEETVMWAVKGITG